MLRPRSIRSHLATHMNLRFAFFSIASSFFILTATGQSPAPSPTVDDLVAKNIEAKGGAAALKAIQTIRFEGRLVVNQGQLELTYTEIKKRPGKVRTDAVLQGMTLVQAYDGASGWKIYPFQGRKDPEKMSADEAKSLDRRRGDRRTAGRLEGAGQDVDLSRHRRRGRHGRAQDKGHAQKRRREFRLSRSGSLPRDPSCSTSASNRAQKWRSKPILAITKRSTAFTFPFSVEAGSKGSTDKQKIILEKGEANIPVDDAIFEFPKTAAKSAK